MEQPSGIALFELKGIKPDKKAEKINENEESPLIKQEPIVNLVYINHFENWTEIIQIEI